MRAIINAFELEQVVALVCKKVKGKRVRERAKALLTFVEGAASIEFNNVSTSCAATVSVTGRYALNPFVFGPFLETFGTSDILLEIENEGVTVGRSRLSHLRLQGNFDQPDAAFESAGRLSSAKASKRQKRLQNKAKPKDDGDRLHGDLLLTSKYVAFKRIDGGIEYGAAVLNYEKGKPGNRNVYVKTKDFQEVWISELEIVQYGHDPSLDFEE